MDFENVDNRSDGHSAGLETLPLRGVLEAGTEK